MPRPAHVSGSSTVVARRSPVSCAARSSCAVRSSPSPLWSHCGSWCQVVGAAFAPSGAAAAPSTAPSAVHVVESGDTLWALAEAVAPESDPRDVVEQIIDMNRGGPAVTPAGQLRAGEELRLPVGS